MSSPLAIGAVSAVLRNLLDNGMVDMGTPLGSVKVTAVAPDSIDLDDPDAPPSLNLFLYRVTPNQGWRNAMLPSFDAGGQRTCRPPLAIDLHYLLTAYGAADFHAEILLGYGMHLLHERPVLDRATIRGALDPSSLGPSILPPAFQALQASDLADQVEAVTLTLEPIDTEELSRLWSATQAHYRPSAAYVASVVLIESTRPTRRPLPVLTRAIGVEPNLLPPFPTIEAVSPDDGQPAARLGETVHLRGHHLDGTATVVRFAHRLLADANEVAIGTTAAGDDVAVAVPSGAAAESDWPAGIYAVTLTTVRPGETRARDSNVAAVLLAPELDVASATVSRDATTRAVTATVAVRPQVRPAQQARLSLGGATATARPNPNPTSSLTFDFGDVPPGDQWARLTVDDVESLLVDRSVEPPRFDPTQVITVPA